MQYITGTDTDLHNKELCAYYEKGIIWSSHSFNHPSSNISFKAYVSVWINDFGEVGISWVSALLSGGGRLWDTAMLQQSKECALLHSHETENILHSKVIFLQISKFTY